MKAQPAIDQAACVGATGADATGIPSVDDAIDAAVAAGARAHWTQIARRWAQLGPPLRPRPEDIAIYAGVVSECAQERRVAPRGLILGVTPELFHLPWAERGRVLAVDHAPAMIRAVWPGPRSAAVCGDWAALPLADASRDIVFCDGGLLLLAYPDRLRAVARELARVVAPGGRCAFRLIVPPARRETADDVFADLLAGRVSNLNVLKVRLWMALQRDAAEGVPLRHVWDALHAVAPDPATLAEKLGWPLEHVLAIDAYRDSAACYYLAGLDDVRRIFCDADAGFAEERVCMPRYELGAQCPTLVLRRRPSS